MSKKLTISLCIIAKNEENYIGQCIQSVKGLVKEVIVVDTGSSDKTVEIAKSLGAKVFFRPWDNDFSAPRNLSLSKATGDWILVLDADEAIDKPDHSKIRKLIRQKDCVYSLTQRHYVHEPTISNFRPCRGEFPHWERNAPGYFDSDCIRLFPNGQGIEFRNVVHELVEPCIHEMNRHKIVIPHILIHHFGHLKRRNESLSKYDLYTELAIKKVENEPENWKAHYEMAVQYQVNRDFPKAIEAFKRCVQLLPSYIPAWVNYGYVLGESGQLDESEKVLLHASKIAPKDNEAWCNLGVLYMRKRDYMSAAKCLMKAVDINKEHVNAWCNLAETMLMLKFYPQALQGYQNVLMMTPSHPKAREGIATCLLMMGKLKEAESFLLSEINQNRQLSRPYYLLGQVYRANGKISEAIASLEKFCSLEALAPNPDKESIAASTNDCQLMRNNALNRTMVGPPAGTGSRS